MATPPQKAGNIDVLERVGRLCRELHNMIFESYTELHKDGKSFQDVEISASYKLPSILHINSAIRRDLIVGYHEHHYRFGDPDKAQRWLRNCVFRAEHADEAQVIQPLDHGMLVVVDMQRGLVRLCVANARGCVRMKVFEAAQVIWASATPSYSAFL